jgi:hypothetical protein
VVHYPEGPCSGKPQKKSTPLIHLPRLRGREERELSTTSYPSRPPLKICVPVMICRLKAVRSVIPAKAGIQANSAGKTNLDSRVRWNDESRKEPAKKSSSASERKPMKNLRGERICHINSRISDRATSGGIPSERRASGPPSSRTCSS